MLRRSTAACFGFIAVPRSQIVSCTEKEGISLNGLFFSSSRRYIFFCLHFQAEELTTQNNSPQVSLLLIDLKASLKALYNATYIPST